MLAIIGAVLFGLALILDLADANLGDTVTASTIVTAGLLCVALHLAGVGARARTGGGWSLRSRR
ncbi:hypothetical protein LWC34_02685 [Kibdelosporangium philippinense]|uniref:Uncharacterized protein n=1 Tax=Kibdelosporangium philippinense TaxID=211113 RepID=A0ABS8Z7F4_9PSEU|nr:hypothetical protein [Kibdelosporangium philippinense]MCE7001752.1 hypothetical protein [Kibdelosporangium philippinense]